MDKLLLDDNLAIIELVNTIQIYNIKINIDIIVTAINNFGKMINNLLLHSSIIKDLVKTNNIRFFRGEQRFEKRHELVMNGVDFEELQLKLWTYLIDSNINKYTICFGFAPILHLQIQNYFPNV